MAHLKHYWNKFSNEFTIFNYQSPLLVNANLISTALSRWTGVVAVAVAVVPDDVTHTYRTILINNFTFCTFSKFPAESLATTAAARPSIVKPQQRCCCWFACPTHLYPTILPTYYVDDEEGKKKKPGFVFKSALGGTYLPSIESCNFSIRNTSESWKWRGREFICGEPPAFTLPR